MLPPAGSHTVLVLLEHGFRVVILDNLDNSFQVGGRGRGLVTQCMPSVPNVDFDRSRGVRTSCLPNPRQRINSIRRCRRPLVPRAQKAYDRMVELAGDLAPNMKFVKAGAGPWGRR